MEQVVASSVTKYELYAQQLKLKQSGEDFNGTKQALRVVWGIGWAIVAHRS